MSRIKFVYEPDKLKHCNKCNLDKPQKEFYRRTSGYLVTPCADCSKAVATENARKYGLNKGPKAQARKQKWLEENRERRNAWAREYSKRPEVVERDGPSHRHHAKLRTARKRNAEGTHTLEEWLSLCAQYGNMCIVPGCKRTDLTEDHVKPLILGGTNFIDNIQPMCGTHNASKGKKEIDYR